MQPFVDKLASSRLPNVSSRLQLAEKTLDDSRITRISDTDFLVGQSYLIPASTEGRKAGVVAWVIQRMARFAVGCELNPIKVQAHFSRGMLASFVSNALLDTGRSLVGKDIVHLVRIRAASLNGCPF